MKERNTNSEMLRSIDNSSQDENQINQGMVDVVSTHSGLAMTMTDTNNSSSDAILANTTSSTTSSTNGAEQPACYCSTSTTSFTSSGRRKEKKLVLPESNKMQSSISSDPLSVRQGQVQIGVPFSNLSACNKQQSTVDSHKEQQKQQQSKQSGCISTPNTSTLKARNNEAYKFERENDKNGINIDTDIDLSPVYQLEHQNQLPPPLPQSSLSNIHVDSHQTTHNRSTYSNLNSTLIGNAMSTTKKSIQSASDKIKFNRTSSTAVYSTNNKGYIFSANDSGKSKSNNVTATCCFASAINVNMTAIKKKPSSSLHISNVDLSSSSSNKRMKGCTMTSTQPNKSNRNTDINQDLLIPKLHEIDNTVAVAADGDDAVDSDLQTFLSMIDAIDDVIPGPK
jgi:hypothetical protein